MEQKNEIIYHTTKTFNLTWKERLGVLFGKPVRVFSQIKTDAPEGTFKVTESKSYTVIGDSVGKSLSLVATS